MKRIRLNDLSSSSETKEHLEDVQRAVLGSQRCIVITGAGISVSSGIPDFRSPDGLFQQLKQRYPQSVASGRDLFDATLFNDRGMVGLFYNFMGELRDLVRQATCTPTHRFIKQLDEQGKLLRCYTQNIDSLEKRIGLETAFQKPLEAEECGATQPVKQENEDASGESSEDIKEPLGARRTLQRANSARRRRQVLDKTFTKAVQLHGDLENVVCTICFTKYPFTEQLAEEFREGAPPPCPHCKEIETLRDMVGKRSIAAGVLRPDIVLYNECHPQGDLIGALSEYDLRRRPDLLIVIGTSLKIPGVKRMVKEMSRCVQSCTVRAKRAGAGKAIFINRDDPPKGWDGVFDYFISGDSDEAVSHLPLTQEGAEEDRSAIAIKQRMAIGSICDLKSDSAPAVVLAEESEADSASESDAQVPVRRARSHRPKDTAVAKTAAKRKGRSQLRAKKLPKATESVKVKKTSSAGKQKASVPAKLTRSASAAAILST